MRQQQANNAGPSLLQPSIESHRNSLANNDIGLGSTHAALAQRTAAVWDQHNGNAVPPADIGLGANLVESPNNIYENWDTRRQRSLLPVASAGSVYMPLQAPPVFFGEALLKQKAAYLPRLRSISTGELLGPFEIDLEGLRAGRETPILQRSSGRSELSCSVQAGVLVINYSGLPVVRCGPLEQEQRRIHLEIRGTDSQAWGSMKPRGRDVANVYWYIVQPDYSMAQPSGVAQPTLLIAQIDGILKVCLHSGQALVPLRQAEESKLAEATEVKNPSDTLKIHLAACNVSALLMISLLLSVKVFNMKIGVADNRDRN